MKTLYKENLAMQNSEKKHFICAWKLSLNKVTTHYKVRKEYLALQYPPKNILFAPGNYQSIKVIRIKSFVKNI